jgi:hypothetical protein
VNWLVFPPASESTWGTLSPHLLIDLIPRRGAWAEGHLVGDRLMQIEECECCHYRFLTAAVCRLLAETAATHWPRSSRFMEDAKCLAEVLEEAAPGDPVDWVAADAAVGPDADTGEGAVQGQLASSLLLLRHPAPVAGLSNAFIAAEVDLERLDRDAAAEFRRSAARAVVETVGYPWRRPVLPEWRTGGVLALARGIFDDRAAERLPVLADALMGAGCDHELLLDHLRSPGPHDRGCWALTDILLPPPPRA